MKTKGKIKILLTGYYGQNNLGDDYIFWAIIDGLSRLGEIDIDLTVETGNPNFIGYSNIAKDYSNISLSVLKTNGIFGKIRKIWHLIFKCNKWIIGGGGLFVTENAAQINHLAKYAKIASKCNVKICMYGIDIDKLSEEKYIHEWKNISPYINFIATRNNMTAKNLIKYINTKIYSLSDVTHGFKTDMEKKEDSKFFKSHNLTKPYIIWTLAAPWSFENLDTDSKKKKRYKTLCDQFRQVVDTYPEYRHVFLPFFEGTDIRMIHDIIDKANVECIVLKNTDLNLGEKRYIFKHAHTAICMRFHGVQFALYNGIPFAAVSYSPKTSNLLNECNLQMIMTEYGIDKNTCFHKEFDMDQDKFNIVVKDAINRKYIDEIKKASLTLRKKAEQGVNILNDWIRC